MAEYVHAQHLLAEGQSVVAGTSGGADSMALLDLLLLLGYRVIAVHVNYGLRGVAADADENHVRSFCEQRGVPLLVHRVDLKRQAPGESVQIAARRLRYEWFIRAARSHDATAVAVAHHADDQAETVLLNLFRGTGPEGLAGMPVRRRLAEGIDLVRPLLFARRSDLEAHLTERGIAWREDATNQDETYRRGFIRNRLLPGVVDEYGPEVVARIARSAELVRDYVEASLRPELAIRFERCRKEGEPSLVVASLGAEPVVWRRRILLEALGRWMPMAPRSSRMAARMDDLLELQPGRRLTVQGGSIWRDREALRFVPDEAGHTAAAVLSEPGVVHIPDAGDVALEIVAPQSATFKRERRGEEYIDFDRLEFPLAVRRWTDGDRFHPLGMAGTRLVSDVLTDRKVPPSRRRDVLVVEDRRGIVWLVGHRLDERLRIHPGTERIAKLSYNPV